MKKIKIIQKIKQKTMKIITLIQEKNSNIYKNNRDD